MWTYRAKNQTTQFIIAQATILKKRGYYAAAKHLIKQQLLEQPTHEELQALYRRIELLQQVKINRCHSIS